jgi:hypothetical protein
VTLRVTRRQRRSRDRHELTSASEQTAPRAKYRRRIPVLVTPRPAEAGPARRETTGPSIAPHAVFRRKTKEPARRTKQVGSRERGYIKPRAPDRSDRSGRCGRPPLARHNLRGRDIPTGPPQSSLHASTWGETRRQTQRWLSTMAMSREGRRHVEVGRPARRGNPSPAPFLRGGSNHPGLRERRLLRGGRRERGSRSARVHVAKPWSALQPFTHPG